MRVRVEEMKERRVSGLVVPQASVQFTYVGVVEDGWVQRRVWVWVVGVWKVLELRINRPVWSGVCVSLFLSEVKVKPFRLRVRVFCG